MKKWKRYILIVSVIFLIMFGVPIRPTASLEDITNVNYIVVEATTATDGTWYVKKASGVSIEEDEYVRLKGNTPNPRFQDPFVWYQNQYICAGELVQPSEEDHDWEEMFQDEEGTRIPYFRVNDWYICYPINREGLIVNFPKGHLTLYDCLIGF